MKLKKIELAIFTIIALVFVLIELNGITHIGPGDENVYYYMAKSVAEGQLPYKDFFYAHPPLHVLVLALIIKIFGISMPMLKSAELFALLAGAFFLYKTSLELFKNRLNDNNHILVSALALILFLFSFEVMFKATFSMGINLSLMLLLIAFYLLFTKNYFIGGVFSGLAGLARFYALIPLLAFFAFILLEKYKEERLKDFLKVLTGFLLTFGLAISVLAIIFGQNFIEPVFKYHLLKPKLPGQKVTVYKNVLFENIPIISSFLLSIFIKNRKKFALFYLAAASYLAFLLLLSTIFEFYFIILFPFMAIIGAFSFVDLTRRIKLQKLIKYALIFFIAAIFFWSTVADMLFLQKIGFLDINPLGEMVGKISGTSKNQYLFGDDSIVPLLALLSNRKIALNFIDSDEKRFTSGLENFYLFTNQLDDVDLSYIILRKNKGIHQILEFREYAEQRCKLDRQYSDITEGVFLFYKC